MLLLKLFLVPAFIGAVSLAGKRWGPGVAGWLSGFPLVAGPILYFLALDRGPEFAAKSAAGAMLAMSSSVIFCIVYCHAAKRTSWPGAFSISMLIWFGCVLALLQLPASPYMSLGVAGAAIIAAPFLIPKGDTHGNKPNLPQYELWVRMIAGALLTVAVTLVANRVGAHWSGVLAGFPVLMIILAIFCHRSDGPAFVADLFGACMKGLYSFVAFAFCLAILLPTWGIGMGFLVAMVAAMVAQWATRNASQPRG